MNHETLTKICLPDGHSSSWPWYNRHCCLSIGRLAGEWSLGHGKTPAPHCQENGIVFVQSTFHVGGEATHLSKIPSTPARVMGVKQMQLVHFKGQTLVKSPRNAHRGCLWLRTPSPKLTSRHNASNSPGAGWLLFSDSSLGQRGSAGGRVLRMLWAVPTAVQQNRWLGADFLLLGEEV